ncbi:type II secretion system minor pseudopilin GspI [Aquisalimonas sp.]|uniref:type II secretion system minor pseudopilin GspI n=1 Tax=Aquisalimonas sp. TaxID=1872621 RepID=UPI0025BF0E7E|nr:type II secretion system minor pseudopilin GspI [Aquisalimonas sp.]
MTASKALNGSRGDLRGRTGARGFTLLEVMIAVAVLAIAMTAVIKAGSEMTANARHLQDRTFAQWVAGNVMAELQAAAFWDDEGDDGIQSLGGQEWYWAFEVQSTPNPDFRRVDVEVYRDEDDDAPVATLTGLISDPAMTETVVLAPEA